MKIRYTISFTLDDIDEAKEHFGGSKEKALEIERANFEEDPASYLDMPTDMVLTVEEVKE